MVPTIDFNNQTSLETDKINNIRAQWLLTPELISGNLSKTQMTP